MWHFECPIIEMKNIKKKRKNTAKLNTNFWPQLYSPMWAHKKQPQALPLPVAPPALLPQTVSGVATQDTGPRPAQTPDLPPSCALPVANGDTGKWTVPRVRTPDPQYSLLLPKPRIINFWNEEAQAPYPHTPQQT
jgi:hypothetical protein